MSWLSPLLARCELKVSSKFCVVMTTAKWGLPGWLLPHWSSGPRCESSYLSLLLFKSVNIILNLDFPICHPSRSSSFVSPETLQAGLLFYPSHWLKCGTGQGFPQIDIDPLTNQYSSGVESLQGTNPNNPMPYLTLFHMSFFNICFKLRRGAGGTRMMVGKGVGRRIC